MSNIKEETDLADQENGPPREPSSLVTVEHNSPDDSPKHPLLKMHVVPPWLKWITSFLTLVFGVLSTYAYKAMNRISVPPCAACAALPFTGAFIQTLSMFIGEALCLPIYYCDLFMSRRKGFYPYFDFVKSPKQIKRKPLRFWWWFIPPIMDCAASTMFAIAMQITYASTVQMLRNFMVCLTAIMQLVLVRKALKVHEYVGVIIITLALALSAIPAIQTPDQSAKDPGRAATGIVLAIIGTSIQAVQMAFEEWLFRKGYFSACEAVGWEGIAGIVYTIIMMPIANATGLEAVWDSWYQWHLSGRIIGWTVGYFFVATMFNLFGVATTKLATGLLRGIIFALRAPIVWIIDLSLKWISYDNWNLASVLVFVVGFELYCHFFDFGHGAFNAAWTKPIHYPCTKRELDDDYEEPSDNDAPTTANSESELKPNVEV